MRALACQECRCELYRMDLAAGPALVLCLACESVGHEHEVMLGAALLAIEPPDQASAGSPSNIR